MTPFKLYLCMWDSSQHPQLIVIYNLLSSNIHCPSLVYDHYAIVLQRNTFHVIITITCYIVAVPY